VKSVIRPKRAEKGAKTGRDGDKVERLCGRIDSMDAGMQRVKKVETP